MINYSHKLCVAPMLDWTDKHCRFFHRMLSPNAMLYSEMLTTGAILHGKGEYLHYNQQEHPLALQLGGSEIEDLKKCTKIAKQFGYDEVNLNCGCPSQRVQKGAFGACLMKEAELVANCYEAMSQTDIPITIKHRIGIDNIQDYNFLLDFVEKVSSKGCKTFIVHARNAILTGLSPKQNRQIPPLKYDYVYKLKQDFSHLNIILNGGINTIEQGLEHLQYVDGIMLGRTAYYNPSILSRLDFSIFSSSIKSFDEIINNIKKYCIYQISNGVYIGAITRHILGLLHGEKNSRLWRQHFSNHLILKQLKTAKEVEIFFEQGQKILEN